MYYIESDSTDPHYNLALEQYVFDALSADRNVFMLWRNDNAVIVGKHQNTIAEINPAYVREKGIRVVRRLSGGGAVYHDLGNVNFTFIVAAANLGAFDFASFCKPVVRALAGLGVKAEITGRNDMTIDGKKFSGNAQYCKQGRVMHHGTILYDSDLTVIGRALNVPADKIESKGLKSVQSRVTNIKEYVAGNIPVEAFMRALRDAMFRENEMEEYVLAPEDMAAIAKLQAEIYDTWDWNYGRSPAYSIRKERRVEGCGKIEIHMNVAKGVVTDAAFYGDYFGSADAAEIAALLKGHRLEAGELAELFKDTPIGEYFHNLDAGAFISILTE